MSCRSRVAGFRKGWQRVKNNWDDFKVEASIEVPTTVLDIDYSKSGGIWTLNSTVQFPKSQSAIVDLETGLTLTNSFPAGTIANGSIDRSVDTVFACEITFPASFNSDGVLFEMGGTGIGAGVGLINSGSTFIVAAGDGAATSSSTIAAISQIATSGLTAGDSGTLVWEFRINPGRVRVWWKGTLLSEDSTTDGSALESNTWSGTDGGGYGEVNSSLVTSLSTGNWPGSTNSTLRYYENQLINA
jgi:hypothetical protein